MIRTFVAFAVALAFAWIVVPWLVRLLDVEITGPCDRCRTFHPTTEPCSPLRAALDVLDPNRPCPLSLPDAVCDRCGRQLLQATDPCCPTCAHEIVARQLVGSTYVPTEDS